LGFSEETLQQELQHAAKLNTKRLGEVAEMAFMRKAATMGFSVAKPWADGERYDFVLRAGKIFWRVQVKSVRSKPPGGNHYRVALVNSLQIPYTAEEIDFVVAYIFPEDTWYVFPVSVVADRTGVCISPKSARSAYEKYREAWNLMECAAAASAT
jgi:hypothetical protein